MLNNVLSKSTKVSLIQAALRKEILDGTWKEGDKLPGDAELAKRFDCSMGTVNRAVSLLAHDGMVVRRPRMGTRVLNGMKGANGKAGLDAFAFIYPSKQHEGIWRTVKGFQEAAEKNERRVVMLSTGSDYQEEGECIIRLAEFDVKGGVIYPLITNGHEQSSFLKVVTESTFPLVIADMSLPGLKRPSVVVDNFHAGYTMTRRLIENGAKKIGFFTNDSLTLTVRDRLNGYLWALQEAKIPEVAELIFLEPSMHPDFAHPLEEPIQLASQYLKQVGDVDGVVCANDILAVGLIEAAHKAGIIVPKKLKVVGIDGLSLAQNRRPTLTTYRVPFEAIGRCAFETLNALISQKKTVVAEKKIRGNLMIGESG